MNRSIKAFQRNGVWHVAVLARSALDESDRERLRQSLASGQTLNLEHYRRLDGAGIWQLELGKACLDDGVIALGLAADFAQRCLDAPNETHMVRAPAAHLSKRHVMRALEARGLHVADSRLQSWIDQMQTGVAIGVAWLFWLGTVVRSLADNKSLPAGAKTLIAVHGEWTNRTRHVLGLVPAASAETVVLVLGRPRASLAATGRLWGANGVIGAKLVRPFSALSAMHSLRTALRLCGQGWALLPHSPQAPCFGEQVGMVYRCLLGAACAAWWKDSQASATAVVYGHTGLADTTLLEIAQQASGATTIHAVHGISAGLNFVGWSSVAIFRCSHDARWHEELGGYGTCKAEPADPPAVAAGREGILFLSNHLHPMNPWYRAFGTADELRALNDIAEAADLRGIPRDKVMWKPHPVFHTLPPGVQNEAIGHAKQLGFSTWLEATPLDRARDFSLVLTTRSTIALDMLRLGILPIILGSSAAGIPDALTHFPLQAHNVEDLVHAASSLTAPVSIERLHAECWSDVGPAAGFRPEHCLSAIA